MLAAPEKDTIKSKRDRAILSTLLFHALRREELCKLKVQDFRHARKGVPHLKVSGKGGKTRYLPLHPGTNGLITDYLDAAGHGTDDAGALFRPIRNNRTGELENAITADGVYRLVRSYSAQLGFEIGAHALRATAATNALDHQADIAKVQEWLGHANIATTRIIPTQGSQLDAKQATRAIRLIAQQERAFGKKRSVTDSVRSVCFWPKKRSILPAHSSMLSAIASISSRPSSKVCTPVRVCQAKHLVVFSVALPSSCLRKSPDM